MNFKNILSVFAVAAVLASCTGAKKGNEKETEKAKGTIVDQDGKTVNVFKGGVFKINEVEKPNSLFPHGIATVYEHRIANQVYQGLVKFDQKSLDIQACLAEKWSMNDDATVFTYNIRKGVKFQDDACFDGGKGREVNAHDFKYCLDMLCGSNKELQNLLRTLVSGKIKGSDAYYEATLAGNAPETGVEGVKVIDDYTLEISLEAPFVEFNKIMATAAGYVFPKEAIAKYGKDFSKKLIGTGPFKAGKMVDLDQTVILVANENYWEQDKNGNQLPYLKGIKYTFMQNKTGEFTNFNDGKLDMVWKVPVEEIENVLKDFDEASSQDATKGNQFQSMDALSIQYYGFLHTSEVFNNKNVRLAFNYAIDREKLVDYTLQGDGNATTYGIVPPMAGYPIETVKGYTFNPDTARALLAAAGYPNGKGFPEIKLQVNTGGGTPEILANEVQHMLKENLGITVKVDPMPMQQHRERYESGNADIWRAGWVADYPSPENFLNLFLSKHKPDENGVAYMNAVRYNNPEFDKLYYQAVSTVNETERMNLFAQADQILINDGVCMPIYNDNYIRLLQHNVKNLPQNVMEYRDFTRVFFSSEGEVKQAE